MARAPTWQGRRALARFGATGGGNIFPPFAEDECGSQGRVGWVVAGDAALGVQLVLGCVTGRMLQHCQCWRGQTAGAFTLLSKAKHVIIHWVRIPRMSALMGPSFFLIKPLALALSRGAACGGLNRNKSNVS